MQLSRSSRANAPHWLTVAHWGIMLYVLPTFSPHRQHASASHTSQEENGSKRRKPVTHCSYKIIFRSTEQYVKMWSRAVRADRSSAEGTPLRDWQRKFVNAEETKVKISNCATRSVEPYLAVFSGNWTNLLEYGGHHAGTAGWPVSENRCCSVHDSCARMDLTEMQSTKWRQ